jgi:hypothetical protein
LPLEKLIVLNMEAVVKSRKKSPITENGTLTVRQIKRRVGDEWAIIKNPVYSEKQVLLSGELYYHNKDKEKVLERMGPGVQGHLALKYFGKPDPNVIYIL